MIREYTQADLTCAAGVWLRSGQAEYHYLPEFQKLTESKAVDVFRRFIQDQCKIWLFEKGNVVVGFMAMDENLIDRLYVDPAYQGKGVGSAFINHAKNLYSEGLVLRTHLQNKRACLFYESKGFALVRHGISPPPESMPDVEYHWSLKEPLNKHL